MLFKSFMSLSTSVYLTLVSDRGVLKSAMLNVNILFPGKSVSFL